MNSNTGTASTFEADDQRTQKRGACHAPLPGQPAPTLPNKMHGMVDEVEDEMKPTGYGHKDPTAAARRQGHKPSRGAQVDEELECSDEEEAKQKEDAKRQASEAKEAIRKRNELRRSKEEPPQPFW